MKGSGSWSMESLHGRILLGAGNTGYWFCDVLGMGALERLLDRLMLKQRMWVFFGSFLLAQLDSIFFLSSLFWFVSGHHN